MKRLFALFFIFGLVAPWESIAMDLSEITKLRGVYEGDSDEESSVNSSLHGSLFSPRDAEAARLDQEELESKLKTFESGNTATDALARRAQELTQSGRTFSSSALNSGRYEKAKGVKHSNSNIDLSVVGDDEWNDGISSAPSLPPFEPQEIRDEEDLQHSSQDINNYAPANSNAPSQDENDGSEPLPALPHHAIEEQKTIDTLSAKYENTLPAIVPHRELPIDPALADRPSPEIPADADPLIQEIPEPNDAPRPAERRHEDLSPDQQAETDLTRTHMPTSQGEQHKPKPAPAPREPRYPHQRNPHKSPVKKVPAKSPAQQHPLPSAPGNQAQPDKQNPQDPAGTNLHNERINNLNMHNLLASAVLLGACSWLQELVLAHKPKTRKFEVLREIVSGAQEALFANIAQQLAPGKKVNSAAFMATFAGLHIAQTGIKHLAQHLMANTKGGKKVAARFQKLPAQKQNAMKHAATATSWFTKTLLAKHLVG